MRRPPRCRLVTIGYQAATVDSFLRALRDGGVGLLVDVRAVASSRRPGFSKSRLAATLAEVGIGYVHLRGLGTPAEGRAAARAGRHARMRAIFLRHLRTHEAQAELAELVDLVQGERRVCLLCFEANPEHCHRALVGAALAERLPIDLVHLQPSDP